MKMACAPSACDISATTVFYLICSWLCCFLKLYELAPICKKKEDIELMAYT